MQKNTICAVAMLWVVLSNGACFAAEKKHRPPGDEKSVAAQDVRGTEQSPLIIREATADQRGTDKAPLVVRNLVPEKSKEEIQQEGTDRAERRADSDTTTRIGWLTFAVLVLQFCAFVFQAWWARKTVAEMKAGTAAAERAAKAAENAALVSQKSADALPKLERAYVFTQLDSPHLVPDNSAGQNPAAFKIKFMNHGKTPAMVKNMRLIIMPATSTPQELPPLSSDHSGIAPGLVIASGTHFPYTTYYSISPGDFPRIRLGELRLYCIGELRYTDVLGSERVTGYCWELVSTPAGYEFRLSPRTPLNHFN